MGKPPKDTKPLTRFISPGDIRPPSTCIKILRDIEERSLEEKPGCFVKPTGGLVVGAEEIS